MPSLFDEFSLKGLTLRNRIMMSPMCQYQAAEDGTLNEWHHVHYGARAVGGVGLLMVEATAVEPRGRISVNDLGIWSDEQVAGFQRLNEFAHRYGAKTAIQIGHAGVKSETKEPNVGPSANDHFSEKYPRPHALTVEEIQGIVASFKQGAVRAVAAGFDAVELHGAHGYLINQFLSGFFNERTDEYGGSAEKRLRFAREVIDAVKGVLPEAMPLLMRVSATEYDERGYGVDEMVEMVKVFKQHGVDMIDVSSGGTIPHLPAGIAPYPGYQAEMSAQIRRAADVPTIAVGMLDHPQLAEEVVRNGRADVVAIGRGFLRNPHWVKEAADALQVEFALPNTYKLA